jgi:4-amino-4-deoxy-L-arabinose transferase-like glycosyltransferase
MLWAAMTCRHVYAIVTLLSAVSAIVLYRLGQQPVVYDAQGYYMRGVFMLRFPFLEWSAIGDLGERTYGYPLFLAPIVYLLLNNLEAEYALARAGHIQIAVAVLQWAILVAAAAFGSWRIARALGSPTVALIAYAALVLHPPLLVMSGVILSDSLSASLIYVAVCCLLPSPGQRTSIACPASLALAGYAAEVRPANVIVIAALVVLWAWRTYWLRDVRVRTLAVGMLALLVPLLPMMATNYHTAGSLSPLTIKGVTYDSQGNAACAS